MKNKRADITNLFRKKVMIQKIPFATKGKPKSSYLLNKKADIAVTIFVLMVIVLCSLALISFTYVESRIKKGGVDDFKKLQEFYNIAESIEYVGNGENYVDLGYGVVDRKLIKSFSNKKLVIEYNLFQR